MVKKIISISIDPGLVEEVDMRRGNLPRSQFIERLIFGLFHKREENIGEVLGYA